MTIPGPSGRWLYVDGWNLGSAGFLGEFVPAAIEEVLTDVTGPASTAPAMLPSGFSRADDLHIPLWADSTLQDLLDDWYGVTPANRIKQRVICYGWTGQPALPDSGAPVKFEGALGRLSKLEVRAPNEQLTLMDTTFKLGNKPKGVELGEVLLPLTVVDADDDTEGDSSDNGAASTAGGAAYIQCTALTLDDATGLDVEVIDSDDDITFGTLVAFTTLVAGKVAERVTVAGTVEQYLAVSWEWDAAPADDEATIFVGFARH